MCDATASPFSHFTSVLTITDSRLISERAILYDANCMTRQSLHICIDNWNSPNRPNQPMPTS